MLLAIVGLQPNSRVSRLVRGDGLQRSGFKLERFSLR